MRWGIIAVTVLWGGVGFAEERVADAQKEADPVQGKIEATAQENDEFVPASQAAILQRQYPHAQSVE